MCPILQSHHQSQDRPYAERGHRIHSNGQQVEFPRVAEVDPQMVHARYQQKQPDGQDDD